MNDSIIDPLIFTGDFAYPKEFAQFHSIEKFYKKVLKDCGNEFENTKVNATNSESFYNTNSLEKAYFILVSLPVYNGFEPPAHLHSIVSANERRISLADIDKLFNTFCKKIASRLGINYVDLKFFHSKNTQSCQIFRNDAISNLIFGTDLKPQEGSGDNIASKPEIKENKNIDFPTAQIKELDAFK